jgi:hypothetical protein
VIEVTATKAKSSTTRMDIANRKLCDFTVALRYEDLPAVAIVAAKVRILSTLAVALAAYDMTPVRIVRKLAQPVARRSSRRDIGSLHMKREICNPESEVKDLECIFEMTSSYQGFL